MDSLTIHGAPLSTTWDRTLDPAARPHWAESGRAATGSAGAMTRAAVIAPEAAQEGDADRMGLPFLIGLTMEMHSLYTHQHGR
jgi:hypothetical protein